MVVPRCDVKVSFRRKGIHKFLAEEPWGKGKCCIPIYSLIEFYEDFFPYILSMADAPTILGMHLILHLVLEVLQIRWSISEIAYQSLSCQLRCVGCSFRQCMSNGLGVMLWLVLNRVVGQHSQNCKVSCGDVVFIREIINLVRSSQVFLSCSVRMDFCVGCSSYGGVRVICIVEGLIGCISGCVVCW